MTHAIHRVTSFEIVGPHTLAVTFADGLTQTIDFLPVLKGELYGPLREPTFFSKAALDPATLHDRPDVADDFAALAKRWAETRSSEAS